MRLHIFILGVFLLILTQCQAEDFSPRPQARQLHQSESASATVDSFTAPAESDSPYQLPGSQVDKIDAAHNADIKTGISPEEIDARQYERRDQTYSAVNAYKQAFLRCVRAGSSNVEDAELQWARAEVLLDQIYEYTIYPKDFPEIDLEQLPAAVKTRYLWHLAQLNLRCGQHLKAKELLQSLDIIRDWLVIGPIESRGFRTFNSQLPPETLDFSLQQTLEGVREMVKWRQVKGVDALGRVRLDTLFRPNEEVLAYALCFVKSPQEQNIALRLGSDDAIAAWINGEEVGRRIVTRKMDLDQMSLAARLQSGWNVIVLKVGQQAADWGFIARITTPEGATIPGLIYSANIPELTGYNPENNDQSEAAGKKLSAFITAPSAERLPLAEIDRGAYSILSAEYSLNENNPEIAYLLAKLFMLRNWVGAEDNEARQLLRNATKIASDNASYWLALAESAREDQRSQPDREINERRQALENALECDPNAIIAQIELANHALSLGRRRAARQLVNAALDANPLSPQAGVIRVELDINDNREVNASARIRDLARRSPAFIPARLIEGKLALNNDNSVQARQAYKNVLQIQALSTEALQGFGEACQRLGEDSVWEQELLRFRANNPAEVFVLRNLAQLYKRQNRTEQALEYINQALDYCPDDVDSLELRSKIYQLLGEEEKAEQDVATAFTLAPNRPDLRASLQALGKEPQLPTSDIDDLEAYAADFDTIPATPGSSRTNLLLEIAIELGSDGLSTVTVHTIVRVDDREAVGDLRRGIIRYSPETQITSIRRSRVARHSGDIAEGVQSGPFLIGEDGFMIIQFPTLESGDVVETEYTLRSFRQNFFGDYFGGLFSLRRNDPVLNARFVLVEAPGRTAHIKVDAISSSSQPPESDAVDEKTGNRMRIWSFHNLPRIASEPNLPPMEEQIPLVQVSTFRDWDDLSRWYYHLVKPQNQSTPEIRSVAQTITANKYSDREKIQELYKWVAENIQNVAWSFGVHGFKPYSAHAIYTRRFGDCKDKATLLNVMARDLGYKADVVLIKALPVEEGQGRGREDFSLPILAHFNHCISRISTDNGQDFFIDPTRGGFPVDHPFETNAGAHAVVIGEEKASIVILEPMSPKTQYWNDQVELAIQSDGSATLTQEIECAGRPAQFISMLFSRTENRDRIIDVLSRKSLGTTFPLRRPGFSHNATTGQVRITTAQYVEKAISGEGKILQAKLPQPIILGDVSKGMPFPDSLLGFARHSIREGDLLLPLVYGVDRQINISWPESWTLLNIPESQIIEMPEAEFAVTYTQFGASLIINYRLQLLSPRIVSGEVYNKFRKLVLQADKSAKRALEFQVN